MLLICVYCHTDVSNAPHMPALVNDKETKHVVCKSCGKAQGNTFTAAMLRTLAGLLPSKAW